MADAFLIDGRFYGRKVPFLDMYADAEEIPDSDSTDPGKAEAYWLAQSARFSGDGRWIHADGTVGADVESVTVEGDLKVATLRGRSYLVVSGDDLFAPAVWVSAPNGQLAATAEGKDAATINGGSWTISAGLVGRLFRHSGTWQPGQAAQLAQMLRKPASPPPIVARPSFSGSTELSWQPVGSGLWTARRDFDQTRLSSFTDLSASRLERVQQLCSIERLPANVLASISRRIVGGVDGIQAESPASGGRYWAPLREPLPGLVNASPAGSSEFSIVDYLWPSVSDQGPPQLEAGEKVVDWWLTPGVRWPLGTADGVVTLTDRRVICVSAQPVDNLVVVSDARSGTLMGKVPPAMLSSEGFTEILDSVLARMEQSGTQRWAWHVRWEWVAGVVLETQRMERMHKASLFAKATRLRTGWSALHVAVLLPSGKHHRVRVAYEEGAPGVVGPTRRSEQVLQVIADWAKDTQLPTELPPARLDLGRRSGESGEVLTREWRISAAAGFSLDL